VTEAEAKKRMGRGGKLNVNIDSVRLLDGEKVPLRAVKEAKGGSHTGAMTGGMVATAIVFFPAAPFFLFMHGKDISILREPKSRLISTATLTWNRPNSSLRQEIQTASRLWPRQRPLNLTSHLLHLTPILKSTVSLSAARRLLSLSQLATMRS
jgi:hypothetical protein